MMGFFTNQEALPNQLPKCLRSKRPYKPDGWEVPTQKQPYSLVLTNKANSLGSFEIDW